MPQNINALGWTLWFNTAVPCFLASFCFYWSGSPYVAFMTEKTMEKEEAIEVASQMDMTVDKQSVLYVMKARVSGQIENFAYPKV